MNKKGSVELIALGLVAILALGGMIWMCAGKNVTGQSISGDICSDTDNGINYYVQGTVSYGPNAFTDTCADNLNRPVDGAGPKVIEYYCRGGGLFTSVQRCVNGCINGACLTSPSGLAFNPDI
jgi:hypothetical protein